MTSSSSDVSLSFSKISETPLTLGHDAPDTLRGEKKEEQGKKGEKKKNSAP